MTRPRLDGRGKSLFYSFLINIKRNDFWLIAFGTIGNGIIGVIGIPRLLNEFIIDFFLEATVEAFENDGFVEDLAFGEIFDVDEGFERSFIAVVFDGALTFFFEGQGTFDGRKRFWQLSHLQMGNRITMDRRP
jgi:hypothetical protein